jgi:SpoVK/Ycf46/Vps4 family AAA+-type ATPase
MGPFSFNKFIRMFIKEDDKTYKILFTDGSKIEKTLKPGVYSLTVQESFFGSSYYLSEVKTFIGKKMINAGIYKEINDLINIHLSPSMTEAKQLLNLRNKLGLMFYGAPGTGKTFTAGLIGQRIVDQMGGYCIITKRVDGKESQTIIEKLRSFTDKPIVYIFDEFEKSFRRSDTDILSFLDGVDSPENIVNLATVNKFQELPDFVTNRPGRFEKVIEFRADDKTIIKSIVNSIVPAKYNSEAFLKKVLDKVEKSSNKTVDKVLLIIRDCLSAQIYHMNKSVVT